MSWSCCRCMACEKTYCSGAHSRYMYCSRRGCITTEGPEPETNARNECVCAANETFGRRRQKSAAAPSTMMNFAERQRVLVRWSRVGDPEEAYAARVLETRGEEGRGGAWTQREVRVQL